MENNQEFQARTAQEMNMLPNGSVIFDMMSEYAVLRDQARAYD